MRPNGFVIAIDGPSGAGKSTLARLLSQRLGYMQIDTGAMYRSAALLISRMGIDLSRLDAVSDFCNTLDIRFQMNGNEKRVLANGEDVTDHIRTPEVSLLTSKVSALAPVREALMASQREMGRVGGVVLEGRDIGTVVFPDADVKFFLTATPQERGRRRFEELRAKGEQVSLEDTVADVVKRDEQDSKRDLAPLRQAEDAIPVDSTTKTIEEVLDMMEASVKSKMEQRGRES